MNTPNNKRKKESIDRIEKAFIELLQKKELVDIRVSDICKKAQLNRTTFYANYDDIYQLADAFREKIEDGFMMEIYKDEIENGYNSNNFLKLFNHIKENQIFYRTYFKLGYDNQYRIFQYDPFLAEEHLGNKMIEYHTEFFRAGITRIIKMWLNNGCEESPEDMFEVIQTEYRGRLADVEKEKAEK